MVDLSIVMYVMVIRLPECNSTMTHLSMDWFSRENWNRKAPWSSWENNSGFRWRFSPTNQSIESGFLRGFLSAVARSSRGNAVPGISAKPTFEVAGGETWDLDYSSNWKNWWENIWENTNMSHMSHMSHYMENIWKIYPNENHMSKNFERGKKTKGIIAQLRLQIMPEQDVEGLHPCPYGFLQISF